jgi:hypothetical protein
MTRELPGYCCLQSDNHYTTQHIINNIPESSSECVQLERIKIIVLESGDELIL